MKKIYFFIFLLYADSIIAQDLKYCGSTEAQKKVFRENPEIYNRYLFKEENLKSKDREAFKTGYKSVISSVSTVYVVPIVFHIIHNYGAENISDAQIKDAVRILNEDFRKLNPDTTSIVNTFKSVAGDSEIEFRLANLDPDGNCTNGIDRIVSSVNFSDPDDAKLNPWPFEQYLNIWTVGKMAWPGVAGYAYYPGTAPQDKDGIMVLADYIGSIGTGSPSKSRVLTHEVGHWLNLAHVWGDTNDPGVACGDDGVSDTPETKGWTVCNLFSNDVCNSGIEENVQNFMEYSYCDRMFTIGQGWRMQDALTDPFGVRNNLWTSANLTATGTDQAPVLCAPKADFKAGYTAICEGTSVNFYDLSITGEVTDWDWTFSGPVIYNSSLQNPVIQFDVPGLYTVTLTAANAAGSDTKTKTSYIDVQSGTATYNAPYSEGFEVVGSDWRFIGDGPGWQYTTSAKYSGTASLGLLNYTSAPGRTDQASSPSLNLIGLSAPKLYCRTAFAQTSSDNTDALKIFYSVNCGRTWILRNTKTGSALATVPAQGSSFIPLSPSQWRLDSLIIPNLYITSNFRFKFEFTSGGGNNIYLDDINIKSSGTTTGLFDIIPEKSFRIHPNPLENNSTVSFSLSERKKISIHLVDIIGRTVSEIAVGEYSPGEHSIKFDHKNLSAGVYFLHLNLDQQRLVQKVIVK